MLATGSLIAQNSRPGFEKYLEKFKSERISFLTEKLELSVEEAQKFWPIYNEYQDKRDELLKSQRMYGRRNGHEKSSEELEIMVDQKVEQELKLAEMKLVFHKKVKKVIPIEKVARLYRAENEFMNHMLTKIREQRPQHGRNRDKLPLN